MIAATAALFLALPFGIVFALPRVPGLARMSPIIPAYIIGLALAVLLPGSDGLYALQDALSSAAVILAIPLMLFSADLSRWQRVGTHALVSLALAVISVTVAVAGSHLLLGRLLPESALVGSLLVAVYTGGTPNLAAIRTALGIDTSLYLTVHTVDILVSALYVFFMITIGPRIFRAILPAGASDDRAVGDDPPRVTAGELANVSFADIVRPAYRRLSLRAAALAVLIVALSAGGAFLLAPQSLTVGAILGVTTLALSASMLPAVRTFTTSFRMGEFLILLFAIVVGSMADINQMLAASPVVLAYVVLVVFGSLTLHVLLARVVRIPADTLMVTSMAAICSPPFIGMLAHTIPEPRTLAAGMSTGIIGYAVGTYLGVLLYSLLSVL